MITTIDVETSYQKTETGGFDPSPFNPNNILVSVGINDEYYFTNHSERVDDGCYHKIQKILDETTLLIGHNIKFDLSWLLEAGFTYTGNVYDTMIAEYVLNRGVRKSLTLLMCCQRRKLDAKDDAVKEYMDRGVSFENIPAEIVEQYGKIDVAITRQLFDSQMADLRTDKHKGLLKTIKVMNEFLIVLTDMERNGINVNLDDLKQVEKEYRAEFAYLKQKIDKIVYDKMGDTKINLGSPEQLSWLIYSKKPKDKKEWVRIFNIGIDKQQIQFLEAFLLYCLLEESPPLSTSALYDIEKNASLIAHQGRQPGLNLYSNQDKISRDEWADKIFIGINKCSSLLSIEHQNAVKAISLRVHNPDLTPSAIMLNEMQNQEKGFFE